MRIHRLLSRICFPSALLISGCGLGTQLPPTEDTVAEVGQPMEGSVYGGRQPITGAHIYMYAASTTGYGASSISLITNYPGGAFPSAVDAGGHYYVTTGSNGAFYLSAGQYACTVGQQVYLYSIDGDPGSGTSNTAAGLMAVLGTCQPGGSFSAVTTSVNMSEISTVAAAYAFAGFASDALHVASSSTALAVTGLTNAFNNAASLYTVSSPNGAVALSATPNGNGTVPQAEINTLANIIAACVNSSGPLSSTCLTLFDNARTNGVVGTAPTDTASAIINIAHNPGAAIATLFFIPSNIVPYQPVLSTLPNDFTIAITYTDTSLDNPYGLAIDASGNAWLTNESGSTVSKFSPTGVVLSGTGVGYTSSNMAQPDGIAIDTAGNAWIADGGGYLIKLTPTGSPTEYTGSDLNGTPFGITLDPFGNLWVAQLSASAAEFSSAGVDLLATTGGNSAHATAIASDNAGNIFISNNVVSFDSVSKFSNAATPLSTGTHAFGFGLSQQGAANTQMGIAIDAAGNFWIPNYRSNTVTQLTTLGNALSGTGVYTGGGLNHPEAIAADGNNTAWVANNTGCLSEFSTGIAVSISSGLAGGPSCTALAGIQAIAVDGSGNVWVANFNAGNVTEVLGVATPVVTPIAASLVAPYTSPGSKP